jgi:arylsulfatase A-like enzyme
MIRRLRYRLACIFLALFVLALPACRRGPVSKMYQEDPLLTEVISARPFVTPDGVAKTYRLTQDILMRRQKAHREPLTIPLESMRVLPGLGNAAAMDRSAVFAMIERTPESIRIAAGDKRSSVEVNLPLLASHYNVLQVTMRADNGARCILSWSSDLEPSVIRNEGVSTPIFPDNEIHTYRIPLDPYFAETWAGLIKSIAFYPSDQPANVEVRELMFLDEPREAPARITLETQTHEALYGTQPRWELTVPERGVLDLHLGMLPRAWEDGRAGAARFVVDMEADSGLVTLVDESLSPSSMEPHRFWLPLSLDLSKYEGQQVRLRLRTEPGESSHHDYAFWGNPVVYGRSSGTAATPVILIVCDTLRADHLSCYGYLRETSPHLDAFAKEAVLFENAITNATWTLPSHGTMFTGLYPKNHSLTANANLPESTVTLAEALRDAGYLTAGYTGFSFWLYPWRGFAHGFDLYNVPEWHVRPVYNTQALLEGWLDNHPVPNLFLFFHNFDVHAKPGTQYDGLPYGPDDPSFLHFANEFVSPPTFKREGRDKIAAEDFMLAANRGQLTVTAEEIAYCIALYDDCIRMVDHHINAFFDKLKEMELYDRALIIVTSDHGEEFGEHGKYGHDNVYEPNARVPLLIRFPNAKHAGIRYPQVVQLTDLYPTVLGVLGLPLPNPVDGQNLLDVLENSRPPLGKAYVQRRNQKAIRTDQFKFIRDVWENSYELYDVIEDLAEQDNLYSDSQDSVSGLRDDLLDFYQVSPEGWHFAYTLADPQWRGDLEVTADSALDTAVLLNASDRQSMILKGRTAVVRMGRSGDDELVLRTTDPLTKLIVNVTAGAEFAVAVGDNDVKTGTEFSIALDPSSEEYPKPGVDVAGKNALRIWYVAPTAKRSAAKTLSEDVVEELRALGYTGD